MANQQRSSVITDECVLGRGVSCEEMCLSTNDIPKSECHKALCAGDCAMRQKRDDSNKVCSTCCTE